jgi:hypothetical protein
LGAREEIDHALRGQEMSIVDEHASQALCGHASGLVNAVDAVDAGRRGV